MNKVKEFFKSFKNGFLDLVFPLHIKCIFCSNEIPEKNVYDSCPKCLGSLPFITKNFCLRCGSQLLDEAEGVCFNCKSTNFNFDSARSVFQYKNQVVNAIHLFKYSSAKYLAEPFAYFLFNKFELLKWNIDFVSFVPIHPNREKTRGYNQAYEIAKMFCSLTNLPLISLFSREIDSPSQTELTRKQRTENIKNAFKFVKPKDISVQDKNILIIDDVYTTGATTNALATLLKNAKVKNVYILTLAHSCLNKDL